LLQSLPQPLQPNQRPEVQAAPVAQAGAASAASEDVTKEEVVPLAQLPTSQPKKEESVALPQPVAVAEPPAASPAVPAVAVAQQKAPPKPEPETTKPVIKPAPATTSGGAQERNILAWKPSEFTIQLVGVSTEKAAHDFVAAQPNKKELLVFKSKRRGKDWFVVITGRYASSGLARQAIAQLPAAQRDAGPWPRDIKTIQSEIKSAM
jgi:DamX protein